MKILHLIDIPWWSGLSAYAFDCMKAQAVMGHRVWLACEKDSLSRKKAFEAGLETFPIRGRRAWNVPFNFIAVGKLIFQKKPDCIVAHTGSTHWIAWWWGKLRKVPVIRTRAISQAVRGGPLNRKIYRDSKWIVAASDHLKNECLRRLTNGLNGKILTIYPPVDNPSLLRQSREEDKELKTRKVGILARLDPKKGYGELLKAQEIVRRSFPDSELHIAGSEENLFWHEILNSSKSLGLKKIFYHGFLQREKVWSFLKSCAVGVIASRESEEVSRALLEWMSAGRPVVATSVGCIPEILKDGEGGFIVPPGDPQALADKIKFLFGRPDLAAKMGRNNFEFCKKRFSTAYFQAEWHKILYDKSNEAA